MDVDRMVEAKIAIMKYLGLDPDNCQSAIIRLKPGEPIYVTIEAIVTDPETDRPLIVDDAVKIKTETLAVTYSDDEDDDETPAGITTVTEPGKDGRWRD